MAKSAQRCIDTNDFEEAYNRYQVARANWIEHWFETCRIIATQCEKWRNKYSFIDEGFRIIEIFIPRKTTLKDSVNTNGVDLLDEANQKVYLFRFYNDNNKFICSKIGTTTRKVLTRLTEELRSKTYTAMGATRAVVDRVYNCYDYPAEGLESEFRAKYILKYPDSFKKNDRFIDIEFDLEEADRIVNEYFARA